MQNPNTHDHQFRVLVADDDPLARHSLTTTLTKAGYNVVVAEDGQQAIDQLADDVFVSVVDLFMPHVDGHKILQTAREEFPDMQVIMVSGNGEIADAVTAMKFGACEYLTKPPRPETVVSAVERAVRTAKLSREHRGLKAAVGQPLPARLASKTPRSKKRMDRIRRIASADSTVLLTGESGTGKSTLARMIHQAGARSDGPFVVVNCASLPRDLIESELFGHSRGAFTGAFNDRPGRAEVADGGTLFLDEIGDLPLELQPKLLTFLQDRTLQRIGSNETRKVDVRVIAATHQDLKTMCQKKRFREDLFYRLNVLNMESKPMRERLDEIPEFAVSILDRITSRSGNSPLELTETALVKLQQYHWPGNIRELENILERAIAFADGDLITADDLEIDLPVDGEPQVTESNSNGVVSRPTLAGLTLSEIEVKAIVETLEACKGNKARSARTLGISEKSIYNKMRRHGLRK